MIYHEELQFVPGLDVPNSLDSLQAGTLTLYAGQLRNESGEVLMRYFRYEGTIGDGDKRVDVSFHPPNDGKHIDQWMAIFDSRLKELHNHWKTILHAYPHRLRRLLWRYGHYVFRVRKIIESMRLRRIKIVYDGVDEVDVYPIKPFESLDPGFTVSKTNKVMSASFDG